MGQGRSCPTPDHDPAQQKREDETRSLEQRRPWCSAEVVRTSGGAGRVFVNIHGEPLTGYKHWFNPAVMGHKTIQMTMRYAHLAPAHTLVAVETLVSTGYLVEATDTRTDTEHFEQAVDVVGNVN